MQLTMKEKQRIEVIMAVMDGRVEVREAGEVLERSDRTIIWMVKRKKTTNLKSNTNALNAITLSLRATCLRATHRQANGSVPARRSAALPTPPK